MQKFKMLSSVEKSYEEQGEIFFLCRNFEKQERKIRERIQRLCKEAAGEYAPALLCYLTTSASWQQVTREYAISDSTLNRCRRDFYARW